MIGMMDLNTQKSRFSLSYIEAVASHAGFQVEEVKVDRDSVDGTLKADFGKRPRIEFQAKATARDVVRERYLHFPLPVKNYDDLRLEAINPRILIVLVMPDSIDEWINQSDQELCLRHCSYWMSLRGEPPTSNQNTITVHLPLGNVFNLVFPILGVFRLNGQPKRDGSTIVRFCKASQSPVYPIRDTILAANHGSCPSLSSSGPRQWGESALKTSRLPGALSLLARSWLYPPSAWRRR